MPQRITDKDLQRQVNQINEALNRPLEAWTDGRANIGNFHLYSAYGSVSLVCTTNASGGVVEVSPLSTKRELYIYMRGFLTGLYAGKD